MLTKPRRCRNMLKEILGLPGTRAFPDPGASTRTRTRTEFLQQQQEQTKAVITKLNSEPRIPKDSAHAEPGY